MSRDRTLDRRQSLLETLELVKKSYLQLIVHKQLEQDAFESARYEELHELSESERIIIEDINGLMKCAVPDLLIHREDGRVRVSLAEIDRLQTSVIRRSLGLTTGLRGRIVKTRKTLEKLNLLPKSSSSAHPGIVNIRA